MKITVTSLNNTIFLLDVSEDLELENFKVFCEIETGFPPQEVTLYYDGKPLIGEKKSLKEHGIKDGDVVNLVRMLEPASTSAVLDDSDEGENIGTFIIKNGKS